MNIPAFTGEASIYRSNRSYRTANMGPGSSLPVDPVVPALTAEGWAACDACKQSCAETYSICMGIALATVWIPWLGGGIGVGCTAESWICLARCDAEGHPCCPIKCGGTCCSFGETCTGHACCPAGRAVCGGTCCDAGDYCVGNECCPADHFRCGDTCCPPNYHCLDGNFCSEYPARSLWPEDWKPPKPPKRGINYCREGYAPCGSTCCPPGLECCSVGGGQVACMTNCLH
jgi:hypothetical protein